MQTLIIPKASFYGTIQRHFSRDTFELVLRALYGDSAEEFVVAYSRLGNQLAMDEHLYAAACALFGLDPLHYAETENGALVRVPEEQVRVPVNTNYANLSTATEALGLPDSASFVDVCSGDGYLPFFLASRNHHVACCDINYEKAMRRVTSTEYRCDDLETPFFFPPGSDWLFDEQMPYHRYVRAVHALKLAYQETGNALPRTTPFLASLASSSVPADVRLRRAYRFLDGYLTYHAEDATRLTFAPDRFDGGFCNFGLGFLEEWQPAVHELTRVVKHGGPVALFQPTPYTQRMPYSMRIFYRTEGSGKSLAYPPAMRTIPTERDLLDFSREHRLAIDKLSGGYGKLMDVFVLRAR